MEAYAGLAASFPGEETSTDALLWRRIRTLVAWASPPRPGRLRHEPRHPLGAGGAEHRSPGGPRASVGSGRVGHHCYNRPRSQTLTKQPVSIPGRSFPGRSRQEKETVESNRRRAPPVIALACSISSCIRIVSPLGTRSLSGPGGVELLPPAVSLHSHVSRPRSVSQRWPTRRLIFAPFAIPSSSGAAGRPPRQLPQAPPPIAPSAERLPCAGNVGAAAVPCRRSRSAQLAGAHLDGVDLPQATQLFQLGSVRVIDGATLDLQKAWWMKHSSIARDDGHADDARPAHVGRGVEHLLLLRVEPSSPLSESRRPAIVA